MSLVTIESLSKLTGISVDEISQAADLAGVDVSDLQQPLSASEQKQLLVALKKKPQATNNSKTKLTLKKGFKNSDSKTIQADIPKPKTINKSHLSRKKSVSNVYEEQKATSSEPVEVVKADDAIDLKSQPEVNLGDSEVVDIQADNNEQTVAEVATANEPIHIFGKVKHKTFTGSARKNFIDKKKTAQNKVDSVSQVSESTHDESDKLDDVSQVNAKEVAQKSAFIKPVNEVAKEVSISGDITVADLAKQLSIKVTDLIKSMFKMGISTTANQVIDQDTCVLIVEEMGHVAKVIVEENVEEEVFNIQYSGQQLPRPPVVTIMGHVDHGKTTLLDYLRKTKVADKEVGGITQHIGAYQITHRKNKITFLDTPGHAAFTAMRGRGAKITDIIILVMAVDDDLMPQAIEVVKHAHESEVPLIVAFNKIDKGLEKIEKLKQSLSSYNVIGEDWGGDVAFINISAKTGEGIDDLLEMISLQAEMMELQAYNQGAAQGTVIEAKLDKGRGAVASVLVQQGKLEKSSYAVLGAAYGRIRTINDDMGKTIKAALPSTPVEITGLDSVPYPGDHLVVVQNEKVAKELVSHRKQKHKKLSSQSRNNINDMFASIAAQDIKYLNIVLKADFQGSLEALKHSLEQIGNQKVKVNFLQEGIGGITSNDIALIHNPEQSIVIGFNVRADSMARNEVKTKNIEMRYYSIIYDVIDDVTKLLTGMLPREYKESILGTAEVREVFTSPKFEQVAGCLVMEGSIHINKKVRVLRDNVVIFEGELDSLRRFKDNVTKVTNGTECGIGIKGYNKIKEGDTIENFEHIEEVAKL